MNRSYRLIVIGSLLMAALTGGCGGGGGNTPQATPATPGTPVTSPVARASDFTGSWSGTYSTGAGVGTPVTFSLVGINAANTVTGNVYSANLSGTFTGVLDESGNVSGVVANMIDGQSWTLQLGILGNVLSIVKMTYGAASLGAGSCTATPALTVNMAGSWKGTMMQKNTTTGLPIVGTTQDVNVELAYDGSGGFIGAIVSDKGLAARVKFVALAGYWACYIDQASSWGTYIPAPQTGTILTEGMIVSTASMQQSFADNAAAPTGMASIVLSDSYPTGTYAPNGSEYIGYIEFLMTLTR
ncbi:hypothetical protein FO488_00240 [Geobacter sp. FeAm09]|uniref:hypothetical protein n=1 Tax=Geobacter sp. FeAm09 TaxID=2597769 RepID=UPI0011ED6365|nr:hypothetical protein [Geobacter sp. FeAm09]QEM66737.1 hypothetical protein FO488_00240 [Geobacter sp. FeAm09]